MADLQVSLALLLENQAEIATQLAAAGGKAGEAFRSRLTPEARKAFDEITNAAEKAAKEVGLKFNKTDLSFRTSEGRFVSPAALQDLAKTNAAFKEAVEGANKLKAAISSASSESASSLNILEAAVTGVAVSLTSKLTDSITAGLGGLKGLVGGFMELDGELRLAAAAAGETGGYERLGAIVEKVGIDAAGTSKQVAELATSLVRAGFSVSEVEKALPGVVRGAEATGTGFEEMGDIIGSTLRGFGLEADQVGRVTDVMVNLANSTNAGIQGMGYTFRDTAPIAKALGISLEEVAAATGLLANAGIQGTVAGTALKHFMQKIQQAAGGATPEVLGLAQGQERLAKVMKMLGAEVLDASGKLLPMDQVLIRLKAGMDKLADGDRVQLTKILFGEDAGPAVLAMLNQTTTEIKKVFADMQNSAGATDVARDAMAGFGLEVQQLQGTLDAIGTSIGGVVAAGLRPFLQVANTLAGAVSGLPGPIKTTGAALIVMASAATAASIGVAALNAAMGTAAWATLRKEITSVAAVLTGPWGAAALLIASAATAAAVLTGNLKETDSTTKTLVQTVVTVGAAFAAWRTALPVTLALAQAFSIITSRAKLAGALTLAQVAAAKGIAAVVTAYKALILVKDAVINRSKIQLSLEALIAGLKSGGKVGAIVTVAGTAAAAGLAYKAISDQLKVAGEETEDLSNKSKELKDEITQIGKEIEQSKKLNIDTSDLEKLKATKIAELKEIEQPLDIRLDLEKAEAQIKKLEEDLKKLDSKDAPGAGAAQAQLDSLKEYTKILKAAQDGVGSKAFNGLSEFGKQAVRDLQAAREEIQNLRNQQLKLDPVIDKAEWDRINKLIEEAEAKAAEIPLNIKPTLSVVELDKQIANFKAKLAELRKPIVQKRGEKDDTFAKRRGENLIQQEDAMRNINQLERLRATAIEASATAAEKQLGTAEREVKTKEEQYEVVTKKAEAENMTVGNQQKQIENAGKLAAIDKTRLDSVRQLADAYIEMSRAMAGLEQAKFDVSKARVGRLISDAQDVLSAMRDSSNDEIDDLQTRSSEELEAVQEQARIRDKMWEKDLQRAKDMGAGGDRINEMERRRASERERSEEQISAMRKRSEEEIKAKRKEAADAAKAKEEEIKALKEREKAIEKEALAAAMAAAAQRFEMERKALELKQLAAKMEQESAVRGAQRAVLEDQRQLIDLKAKQKDHTLTPEMRAEYEKAIALQEESIALSKAQVSAEKEALGRLGQQFAMEKEMLALKQNTEVEGFRAQAAKGGWEGDLAPQLAQLDEQKGKVGELEIAWKDVAGQADQLLGLVNQHNEAIDKGVQKLGNLADAYRNAGIAAREASAGAPQAGGGAQEGPGGAMTDGGNQARKGRDAQMEAAGWQKLAGEANSYFISYIRKGFNAAGQEISRNTWSDILSFDKKGNATIRKYDDYLMERDNPQLGAAGDPNARERMKWLNDANAEMDKLGGRSKLAADEAKRLQDAYARPNFDIIVNADTKGAESKLEAFDKKLKQNEDKIADQEWQIRLRTPISTTADPRDNKPQIVGDTKPFEEGLARLRAERESLLKERQSFISDLQAYPDFSLRAQLDTSPAKKQLTDFDKENDNAIAKIKLAGDATDAFKQLDKYNSKIEQIDEKIAKNDFAERMRIHDAATSAESLNDPKYKNIDAGSGAYDALNRRLQAEREGLLKEREAFVDRINDPFKDDFSLRPAVDTTQVVSDLQALGAEGQGVGYDLQAGFNTAANSIVPFKDQVNQLGLDLQAFDGNNVDPFAGTGQSLAEAAYGTQALVQGLEAAKQTATEFDTALTDGTATDQIQQAYDALKPPDVSQAVTEQGNLAQGTEGTVNTTDDLANSWANVATGINAAAQALSAYKSQESGGNARFAGGDVLGGKQYTVNELGQESFLSRSGALSLIRAPQYGKWVAPSRGLVIPASMTSKLQAVGAFGTRGGVAPVQAMASPSQGSGNQVAAISKLQRSIDRLEKTMGSYRPPDVTVTMPGNAGLLHTLQSIR